MRGSNRPGLIGSMLFLILWGCGYHIEGPSTSLPTGIRTVAIPTMANETLEAGIENVFTRAIIREFNRDGRLKVVPEHRADAVLEGNVFEFLISSVSYDEAGFALVYRAQVTLGVTFRRLDTDEILWNVPFLRETQDYRAVSNVLTNEANKAEAIEEIARQLAENIHDQLVEGF